MNIYLKVLFAIELLMLLTACANDPPYSGYYRSTNTTYGQGNNYAYPNTGYSGYGQSAYGYSNYPPQAYCPDEDD